jgi:hypothetical protein
MLIDYLTLNYMIAYFWIAIWLSYQLLIHACSKANFKENYFFCKFFLCFQLLVWSVRMDLFLSPDTNGSIDRWSSSVSSGRGSVRDPVGFLCHPHNSAFFFLIFVMLCVLLAVFSQDFGFLYTSLLIPWYFLWLSLFF